MSKIRESARGQQCQVRLPCCNHNPETVILAHIGGGGMAAKQPDSEGAYCCSSCHDVLDGRVKSGIDGRLLKLYHHEAAMRTRKMLVDQGLMILK